MAATYQITALFRGAFPVLLSLTFTLMSWKALCLVTASPSPVMCVISESMAPAFHRGDLIFLWNRTPRIHAGDIPVVWFAGNPTPMVHRAVQVFVDGFEANLNNTITNTALPR